MAEDGFSGDAGRLARALEISAKGNGEGHPDTLALSELMGLALYARGNAGGARDRLALALKASEGSLGEGDPRSMRIAGNLGCACLALGEGKRAKALLERACGENPAAADPGSLDLMLALNNLGCAEAAAGDPDAAIPLLRRSAGAVEALLGAGHPDALAVRENLARAEALGEDEGDVPWPDAGTGMEASASAVTEKELAALASELARSYCDKAGRGPGHPATRAAWDAMGDALFGPRAVPWTRRHEISRKLWEKVKKWGRSSPRALDEAIAAGTIFMGGPGVQKFMKPGRPWPADFPKAKALLAWGAAGSGILVSPDRLATFGGEANLSLAMSQTGDSDSAQLLAVDALDKFITEFGFFSETSARLMNNAALVMKMAGRHDMEKKYTADAKKARDGARRARDLKGSGQDFLDTVPIAGGDDEWP
jgi:hypothetical protein